MTVVERIAENAVCFSASRISIFSAFHCFTSNSIKDITFLTKQNTWDGCSPCFWTLCKPKQINLEIVVSWSTSLLRNEQNKSTTQQFFNNSRVRHQTSESIHWQVWMLYINPCVNARCSQTRCCWTEQLFITNNHPVDVSVYLIERTPDINRAVLNDLVHDFRDRLGEVRVGKLGSETNTEDVLTLCMYDEVRLFKYNKI